MRRLLLRCIRAMTERACSVEGCERKHYGRGLCKMHWKWWRNTGSVELAVREPRVCSVEGCERKHRSNGLCVMHLRRLLDTGSVGEAAPRFVHDHPDVCAVDGCVRPYHAKGLCNMHYLRLRADGSVGEAAPRLVSDHPDACTLDGCERPYRTKGLCSMHYKRLLKTGSPGSSITKPRYLCHVCDHPEVEEIDARLRRGDGGFGPDYGLTHKWVRHHKYKHLDNEQYYARSAAEAVKILNEARAAVRG